MTRLIISHLPLPRSASLVLAAAAATGAAIVYLPSVPGIWLVSPGWAVAFATAGALQLGSALAVSWRPTRLLAIVAAGTAVAFLAVWLLVRVLRVLPGPDPLAPLNTVLGFADDLCAILEAVAVVGLGWAALHVPSGRRSRLRRAGTVLAAMPIALAVILLSSIGLLASTDGFTGAGLAAGSIALSSLSAGASGTVEYCRPDGIPLAMDLYLPPPNRRTGEGAPVALYVHRGGAWGGRKQVGMGAALANPEGALFGRLRDALTARGFVVAAIDYRLPPGTPWPAQLEDAKCAVRFLRAHADDLRIDPDRIGAWGSSGGGVISALLGLTASAQQYDVGQYGDQSSAVQAVVDMFGPPDLDAVRPSAFGRLVLQLTFGDSAAVRREASPASHVSGSAPPILDIQGSADPMTPMQQAAAFVASLQEEGAPATLLGVQGAGHGLDTPGEQPAGTEIAERVVDFFVSRLQ